MFVPNADHLKFFYCLGTLMLCSSTTADLEPSMLAIQPPLGHVKAPYWNKETASLYFVSDKPSTVHRYHPETNHFFSAPLDTNETLSFVVSIRTPKTFAAGFGTTVHTFSWDGSSPELISIDSGFLIFDLVMIAGKVHADGYLWVALENGDLISVPDDGFWDLQLTKAGKLYGYAWSVYDTKIYVVDADTSVLMQYDFPTSMPSDPLKGTVLFDFKKHGFDGTPKSINVDDKNHAWVALSGSDKIVRVDTSNGTQFSTVSLPVMTVGSLAFGGPNMDILFVTTDQDGTAPDAGCLFQMKVFGSKGLPSESSVLIRLI